MLYLIILIVSAIAQYFGPWWVMPIVCFGACLLLKTDSAKGAYGIAAAAITTLWLGYAGFQHFMTDGLMTGKITEIFLQGLPYNALLITITGVIGGLVAGFAGMAGHYTRAAFVN
jgi:hypothetical protein